MPSPVGHGLAGLAVGWLVCGTRRGAALPGQTAAIVFVTLGVLPDIDLLFGAHSGPTHGLGSAVVAGAAGAILAPRIDPGERSRIRFGAACLLAYASHTLLDWLGTDTSAPIGIMALWPWTREYYESGLHIFMAISRRYWQPEWFWRQNLAALARELLVMIPIVVVIARLRATGK